MSYIKVSNNGILDIVKACSMLGASVKNDAKTSIGMFGTGLKYALAQAMRMGIVVHIASGEDIFETFLEADTFRGQEFEKVHLRNIHTGKEHETPITTNFGQHDWVDLWCIYREIVCNAKDEEGFNVVLVDKIRRTTANTSIYLPYETFRLFYDREADYFAKDDETFIRKGEGIVYKKGVRIGQIEGLKLDVQQSDISISESRQMSDWSARWAVGYLMGDCTDADVWEQFLQSDKYDEYTVNCSRTPVMKAFATAMKRVNGKFVLSVDDDAINKDLKEIDIHAFIKPTSWTIDETAIPSYKDKLSVDKNLIRDPNVRELRVISWGLECCKQYNMNTEVKIKVFDEIKALGYSDMKEGAIWLSSLVFFDRREFLMTLLEEIGHIDSEAKDYTREFTDFFIGKIADSYIDNNLPRGVFG